MRTWMPRTAFALLAFIMAGAPIPGLRGTQAAAQAAAPIETASWPHTITAADGSATIYEPQAITWPDLKTLTARAAVSITPTGAAAPFFGTIELSVGTEANLDTRQVTLTAPTLLASHFPSLEPAQAARLEGRIRAVMAALPPKRLALDTILLSLKEAPTATPGDVALRNDPPAIFVSGKPASLVVFDGEPVLTPIGGGTLSFAVNTNWDVFKDADGTWYLLNGAHWLKAPAASGPWSAVARLPPAFAALPNDANFAQVRKAVPAKPFAPGSVPTIFVSTTPAEIIVTAGPPQFMPLAGTALQYVANTGSDLFLDPAGGHFYYLVSGRWFSAPGLDGPWSFATPSLPPDFAHIDPNGPRRSVLASVPGTPQAQQAVIQAQIPRQASLPRGTTISVSYGGPPRFAPIPGTTVEYAVNTHDDVLRIDGVYYACVHGAWFKSASATGPWVPADSVPAAVYTIPPVSPLYPVTYVKVYAATPQAITYGYTAGYVMGYVSAGVVAYGTGYYYPPVVVPGPVPAYYPYPYSYAGGVYYNSATGAWAQGGAVYGPYSGARAGVAYNPNTGAYVGGAAVYGPNGGAGAFSAYNPSTGSYAHGSAAWGPNGGSANANWYNARSGVSGTTNQNSNPYERWGSSTLTGPNATVHTQSGGNAQGSAGSFSSSTGAQGAGVHGAGGNSAGAVKGANGDVYAGADGNVYKHTSDGWSKYDNGSWNPVTPPTRPTNTGATQSAANGAGTHTTQPTSQAPGNPAPSSTAPARSNAQTHTQAATPTAAPASAQTRSPTQSSSYGQLEQDRQARSFGARQTQQSGGMGRFGGRAAHPGTRRFR